MPWVQQRLRRMLRESSRERRAEVHAQDAEREQQRGGVLVECIGPYGDGVGGDSSEAGRALEGNGGGVMCREGVDGVEQGASMVACGAEGDDKDKAMVGDENLSVQRVEGGGGSTGGIKRKRPPRKRAKGAQSHKQRQDAARPGWAREA